MNLSDKDKCDLMEVFEHGKVRFLREGRNFWY